MYKLYFILISILYAIPAMALERSSYNDSLKLVYVDISARNLSLAAVDSYPQKIVKIITDSDTLKTVRISTFSPYEDKIVVNKLKAAPYSSTQAMKYDISITSYLTPTYYVNSNSAITKSIADTLFDGSEKVCVEVIAKALSYSRKLKFDKELAMKLDAGYSMTIPSDSVVLIGKGTCSESTNIFLALMRHKGIPSRMVVGFGYEPAYNVNSSHAWAECYIEGVGWWGVDPQTGSLARPYFLYKLFVGKDFADCNIRTLPDMYLKGKYSYKAEKLDSICINDF